MHRGIRVLLIPAVLAVAGSAFFVGYLAGRSSVESNGATTQESTSKLDEAEATPTVKVAPIRQAKMEKTVWAYGTVIANPEDVQSVSVPFESRVRRVLVAAGEAVDGKTTLVEVEPSPDALLQLRDARSTREAAAKDVAQAQQRLEMKLATKLELLTAQQALDLAQSKLDSLQKRGIERRQLQANIVGLVSKIDVQEGQIVPAGNPLVEVVPTDRVQVKLGIEPVNAGEIKPGQIVHIKPAQSQGAKAVDGQVRMITRRVNPSSRLVDVFVSLPPASPMLLETYVRGQVVVATRQVLAVPRSAVLPEEEKRFLYTVKDGKAIKREVTVGLEDDKDVEISGQDITAGQPVVIEGNYELEDGMTVNVDSENKS